MQVRFSVSLCKQLWVWNNRQCDATDRQYDVTDSEAHVMSMSCDACHVMSCAVYLLLALLTEVGVVSFEPFPLHKFLECFLHHVGGDGQ